MGVSEKGWQAYISRLGKLQDKAASQMISAIEETRNESAEVSFCGVANDEQWVGWKLVERNGRMAKIPVNPVTGGNAKTNTPVTWGTLDQALRAVEQGQADGVGLVLGNGYFGIDLDNVIDPETGTVKIFAQEIVDKMDSYTEISPSGRGIHIIAKGSPDFSSNKNGPVEMYYPKVNADGTISQGRYFTVTGNSYGPARAVAERTEQAEQIWEQYISGKPALPDGAASPEDFYRLNLGRSDADVLAAKAYGISTTYGEAAASLSADMYDATARVSKKALPPAEVAETADYSEVSKTVHGVLKTSKNPDEMAGAVSRLVKRAAADTTLKNAARDGAEWAWVPNGDTCAFCITLASRGWQRQSKKAMKGGHAEHIHAHCDCTYAVRFGGSGGVAGYDPDRCLQMYRDASDGSPKDKINALRRASYAENREKIDAQQRAAYALRKEAEKEAGV